MTMPIAVIDYLKFIPDPDRSFVYFKLDSHHRVVENGGGLESCGFKPLDVNIPIDTQIDLLAGILPVTDDPVVISNAHVKDCAFIDIHVFCDDGFQWVLLLDNTRAGRKLQAEQQSRLTDDIAKESGGSGGT